MGIIYKPGILHRKLLGSQSLPRKDNGIVLSDNNGGIFWHIHLAHKSWLAVRSKHGNGPAHPTRVAVNLKSGRAALNEMCLTLGRCFFDNCGDPICNWFLIWSYRVILAIYWDAAASCCIQTYSESILMSMSQLSPNWVSNRKHEKCTGKICWLIKNIYKVSPPSTIKLT